MSWLPVFNSVLAFVLIPSVFLWEWGGLYLVMVLFSVCFVYLVGEVAYLKHRFSSAFALFILSEFMIFLTLFTVTLWLKDAEDGETISDWSELPFLGCFVLIGSSVLVTAWHHSGDRQASRFYLYGTLVLGSCFILLQLFEFYSCECDVGYSPFYSGSFSTTGLHFTHVLLGLFALGFILVRGSGLSSYYVDLPVWYWHFVDYIWLLVYMVVYII